ncbi:hypothetical protein OG440_39735 (plasmid) [Streptomyces sp. NBC_00637]|uniref:hypothetical protein n=1 Tax=Streptomyces sp. NBC_00637 TaxID=2903667 RepID=UPI003249E089
MAATIRRGEHGGRYPLAVLRCRGRDNPPLQAAIKVEGGQVPRPGTEGGVQKRQQDQQHDSAQPAACRGPVVTEGLPHRISRVLSVPDNPGTVVHRTPKAAFGRWIHPIR